MLMSMFPEGSTTKFVIRLIFAEVGDKVEGFMWM